MGEELSDLQERLFAEGLSGGRRAVLLVLQGMDTSGKGGTLRHTVGLIDPQGVRITSFKAPTEEERAPRLPVAHRAARSRRPGYVGVFDRSHYEDVLIARVRELATADEIERRYDAINAFEQRAGRERHDGRQVHAAHLGRTTRRNACSRASTTRRSTGSSTPATSTSVRLWPSYQEAYEIALERTHTEVAPWYVVPSDKKWYRNLAIGFLLPDTLRRLDPQWPAADFDVAEQRARLSDEAPFA